MELRQTRPYTSEGRKTTHDFLSLYSPATQQDPRSPPQGGFLKIHNFLQPLEQGSNTVAKEEEVIDIKDEEKPPPETAAYPSNVEHILPGGIGTYSITYFNQRLPKPDGSLFMTAQASCNNMNDENSNCSSYTGGSGFTLWDESASAKKGKTGKENNAGDRPVLREAGINVVRSEEWPASLERPSQSSSNHKQNIRSFSSLSSSQPSSPPKNRGFMNILTSAKSIQDDDDDDEEEFTVKKEPLSLPKGNLSVQVDGRSNDQKPSTPRSKHSATEQRRRSKINDRFQKLREIIPHSDQKRDKASFLLEVIEYIQFLQEKVEKYEGPYPGWNQEAPKLMPWRTPRAPEELVNPNQAIKMGSNPALMLPAKFERSKSSSSPPCLINGHHPVVESDLSNPSTFREKFHQPESTNTTTPIPMSQGPGFLPFGGSSSALVPLSSRPVSDAEQTASQPASQFWTRDSTADSAIMDKLKEQELAIESGTISISSIYSQGLFSTLTQALQNSGVDLSQANISVQIDLGKRANGRVNSSASIIKDIDMPSTRQAVPRSSVISTGEDCSGQALKRIKTCRS